MDKKPISGVLFDMDGLVLDTETLYCRFWQEAAQALGFPMTRQQALSLRSLGRQDVQEKLNRWFGPDAQYDPVRNKRIQMMDAFIACHGVSPKPGIYQLLDALEARHIPAAIASSSPMDRIREYLTPLGLYHRFQAICSGYDMPRGKPAPDIYLHAAAALHLPPQECLALEDSPAGILSAYRAGCLPVLIPDQDVPGEQTQALLYAQVSSLDQVIDLL